MGSWLCVTDNGDQDFSLRGPACPLESQFLISEEGQHLFLWPQEIFASLLSTIPSPPDAVFCFQSMRFLAPKI